VYTTFRSYFKNNKLFSDASIYILGNILQKALSFLMIPLYTRFLTPDDYGIIGVSVAVESVLTILLGFGISGSIVRHFYDYKDDTKRLKEFITTNFVFLILSAGIITLYLNYYGKELWNLLLSERVPFSPYIQIVLWNSFAGLLAQIPLSLYRAQQKARSFMVAQVSNFLLTLLFTICFVVILHFGAIGALLGSMVASVITTFSLSVLLLRKWFSFHLNLQYVWISLVFGLPLVPHSLSTWIMASVDRILLEPRVSLNELGIYNLGYQIGQIMAVLVTSINFAWAPYYYNLVKTDSEAVKRIKQISELYLALIGGICLIGVLFSPEILHFLVPKQYQLAEKYIPLILFSYLFNGYYYFASMPLFYFKKTHIVLITTFASATLNILLNLWWIPIWGAMGSAWATLVVYILTATLAYFLGRRWQKTDYPIKSLVLLNLLIFTSVLLTTYDLNLNVIEFILIKISILIIFFIFAFLRLIKPNLGHYVLMPIIKK
jgi:O-antigen/teichoic acid export membrane protein